MQFILLFLLACFSSILCYGQDEIQTFSIGHPGSFPLLGHYSLPQNTDSYPIVILIQGSQKESVQTLHNKFYPLITSLKLGLLTVECPGVGSEGFDNTLFNNHDSFNERLSNYHFLVEQLRNNFLFAWNRELILCISDGGIIAGRLAKDLPEIKALALIGTGGGMSVRDELLISMLRTKSIKQITILEKETHALKNQMEAIEKNPNKDTFWKDHSYRFWASIFNEQILENTKHLTIPIFYAFGTKNDLFPIESADRFALYFQKNKLTNLVYKRYENTNDIVFSQNTLVDLAKWMNSISMEFKVFKSKKTLEVYKFGKCVKVYPIAVGKSEMGHKKREGDMKTPEGEYFICVKNPKSKYCLSVGLNYPNNKDAEIGVAEKAISQKEYKEIISANAQGKIPLWKTSLGGEIFIHGYLEEQNWTHGCIRMYNKDIKELYPQVALGMKITIYP